MQQPLGLTKQCLMRTLSQATPRVISVTEWPCLQPSSAVPLSPGTHPGSWPSPSPRQGVSVSCCHC